MKLKFNWGTGIFIFIIIGISWYVFLVIFSMKQDFYMVEDDYYSQGINYDKHIEKIRNARFLNEKFSVELYRDSLILKLPDWDSSYVSQGTISFYRSDNEDYDFKLALDVDRNGKQIIDIKNRRKGKYMIKLDWQMNNTQFYDESTVILY